MDGWMDGWMDGMDGILLRSLVQLEHLAVLITEPTDLLCVISSSLLWSLEDLSDNCYFSPLPPLFPAPFTTVSTVPFLLLITGSLGELFYHNYHNKA